MLDRQQLKSYRCDDRRSIMQLIWSAGSVMALYVSLIYSLSSAFLVSLFLAAIIGILSLRLFSLMHDCSHYAYFTSRKANEWVGVGLGLLTLTPFFYWKYFHLKHHGATGNLDRRGWGDILTYTVEEYQNLSPRERFVYRAYRSPWVYLLAGPFIYFFILMRNPFSVRRGSRERLSCHVVNLAWISAYAAMMVAGVDLARFFACQMMTTLVAGSIGLWLFYVQHQFETTYWKHSKDWDFYQAAWYGSSYLELPRAAEWLIASVNLHNVHHLDASVPNYRLRERMDSLPEAFGAGSTRSLAAALKAFRLKLWDENRGLLVGFPDTNQATRLGSECRDGAKASL